ncbi:MAG: OprD family outer membrane porin [Rudaea sp.]
MRRILAIASIATALVVFAAYAHADALSDIVTQGQINGELRSYFFSRLYDTSTVPDANAFSAAALINARTGTIAGGFSINTSFLTASSLGTQSGTASHVDKTLMGPSDSISALGQANLQYKNDWALLRGGYQYLSTPWMGSSDARVLPASYNALSFNFKPLAGWDVYALRSFDWKSRTSHDYRSTNLYYPSSFDGDAMYGGIAVLPATTSKANGVWALGSAYAQGGFRGRLWYYEFLRFARMTYANVGYTWNTRTGWDPFVAAQYVHESSGENNNFVMTGTKLFGMAGDAVRNRTWGVDAGIAFANVKFDVGYNRVAEQDRAVGSGALISPYTVGYASDPLYTSSMIRGLVEQGPGYAWKATLSYGFIQGKLLFTTSYAKYTTLLRGRSDNLYFDVAWSLDDYLKGLSLRNRWERSSGGIGANPGDRPFTYNRLMVSYKF